MSLCFICEGKFSQGALAEQNSEGKKLEVCRRHRLVQCIHGLARVQDCSGPGYRDHKCLSLCRVNGCTKTVPLFITGKHSYRLNNFIKSDNRCPEHIKICRCGNRLSLLGYGDVCVDCSEIAYGPPTLLVLMILRRYFDSETTKSIMSHLKIIQKKC